MNLLNDSFNLVDYAKYDPLVPKMIPLPRRVCAELVLVSVLMPLMVTNLGAQLMEKVFATDASIEKGAILEADIDHNRNIALHRCFRTKGAYTKLQAAVERVDDDIDDLNAFAAGPPRPLAFHFDFVEVYAGAAVVTDAMNARGYVCCPPIDLSFSSHYDLKAVTIISWLTYLITQQRIKCFMVEPPCTTFSIMRRPALRDRDHPYGFDVEDPQTHDGNVLGQRAFQLIHCGIKYQTPGILETPHSSKLKNMPSWDNLVNHNEASILGLTPADLDRPTERASCSSVPGWTSPQSPRSANAARSMFRSKGSTQRRAQPTSLSSRKALLRCSTQPFWPAPLRTFLKMK